MCYVSISRTMTVGPAERPGLVVRITTDGDLPVEGVTVCAIARNGTTIDAATGSDGRTLLQLLEGRAYRILIAHPNYATRVVDDFNIGEGVDIRVPFSGRVGSLIIHSTGHIPHLNGRLNPICDTLGRTYLYANNISINGGVAQPAKFVVNEPIELEDAQGSKFKIRIKLIEGQTSLIEYSNVD